MSNYSWLNEAFAWLGPVAAQATGVTFCKDRVYAFVGGSAVAEYTAPTHLPVDDPIEVPWKAIKTIDWSAVTGFKVGKQLELGLYGGKVKIPQAPCIFDPEAIVTDGVAYPAADFKVALAAVLPAVARDAAGGWQGNVHIQGDLVAGSSMGATIVRFVWLPYELERQAEIPYDAAKMLAGLSLDEDAEVYFDGTLDIPAQKMENGKRVEYVAGQSFAGMTVVSGRGSLRVPLSYSSPVKLQEFVRSTVDNCTHHVNISPDLGGLIKTINALAAKNENTHIILSFGDDGVTINSNHVERAVIAAEYADNETPPFAMWIRTELLDVSAREWLRIGLSGQLNPVIIHGDDVTILVAPMKPIENTKEKAE